MHATNVIQECGRSESIGVLSFSVEEFKGKMFSLLLLLMSSAKNSVLLLH